MERPFICKCLTAEYEEEKSVLRGPVHIQFDILSFINCFIAGTFGGLWRLIFF